MRDGRLWTQPKSLLRPVSSGHAEAGWGAAGKGASAGREPALGREACPWRPSLPAKATTHSRAGLAGPPPRTLSTTTPPTCPGPGGSWRQLRPQFLGQCCRGAGWAPHPCPSLRFPRQATGLSAPRPRPQTPRCSQALGGGSLWVQGQFLGAWLSLPLI